MSEEPTVIAELERRLIDAYYGDAAGARALLRTRRWVPQVGVALMLAVVAAVVVIALVPGNGAAPAALNRAARAASAAPFEKLGGDRVWSARVIQSFDYPKQPRSVSDIRITASGRFTDRTVRAGSPVDSFTTNGHGKLASPLWPGTLLLSYRALLDLPDQIPQLRRAVVGIQSEIDPASRSGTATGSFTSTTSTNEGHGVVITKVEGTCCGTSPQDKATVGELTTISWLLALPVRPSVRAALDRLAASLPGVRYDGMVRDVLGRRGVEVSVGSGENQLRLIVSEQTGALLQTSVSYGKAAQEKGVGPLTFTLQSAEVTG